jgi:hypothetical protein
VLPSQYSDSVIVEEKNLGITEHGRGAIILEIFFSHSIKGKGKHTSSGVVKTSFYDQIKIGDNLIVHFSRIFNSWKRVELVKNGVVVESAMTKEILPSILFIIIFCIPLYSFKPSDMWWNASIFWISYCIISLFAFGSWIKFLLSLI